MLDQVGSRRMEVARRVLRRLVSGSHGQRVQTGDRPAGRASRAITREVVVHVVAPPDVPTYVPVVMSYDIADPYAVSASLPAAPGQDVTWVFARDLMSQGLRAPSGDGDVRIWPAGSGGNGVCIALTSPDGDALVQATISDIDEFLRESYSLCPRGREGDHLDVDGALRMLLTS